MTDLVNQPTVTNPVKTMGDMMAALEAHAQDVIAGRMTDAQARNLIRFRNAQLKAAELQLQYTRAFKGRTPDPVMLLLPRAEVQATALTPEEEATLQSLLAKSGRA